MIVKWVCFHFPICKAACYEQIFASMKRNPFSIKAEAKGQEGVLVISGYINPFNQNAATEVLNAFHELERDHDVVRVKLLNCMGGSVYEGIPVYNAIKDSKKRVVTEVEGIAASMGAVLFVSGHEREMARASRLMTHEARGGIYGTYQDIVDYAEMIKDISGDLAKLFSEQLGKDVAWVESTLMPPGRDIYLTVEKCLEYGLATKAIASETITEEVPEDVLEPAAVFEFYQNQVSNQKQTSMSKIALIAAALSLDSAAGEDQVLNTVQSLVNEKAQNERRIQELEAALERQTEDQAKALVEAAINDGRIQKAQENYMVNMAKADMEGTRKFLEGLAPHETVHDKLNRGNGGASAEAKFEGKGYMELIKTPEGSAYLRKLSKESPEKFNELKSAVGKED